MPSENDRENEQHLRELNQQLIVEENAGRRTFFEERLAPVFVLRRANGEFQDRNAFLRLLTPDGDRVCDPESIRITALGAARALVTCMVQTRGQSIHNARLFALSDQGRWQLIAWVNERT